MHSRYHSNCAPLRTTSSRPISLYALTQHSRKTPTRLSPLGPSARKGWEHCSPLPESHHPRLSEKFVAGPSSSQLLLLFEVKQPLCVNAACAGDPTGPKGGSGSGSEGTGSGAFRAGSHQPPALCSGPSPATLRHSLHIQFRQIYHSQKRMSILFWVKSNKNFITLSNCTAKHQSGALSL